MEIEELIRDAQQRQADRAVDPARIRAALPRRATRVARHTRRRNGAFGAGVAALAAAAAIAIPVVIAGGQPQTGGTQVGQSAPPPSPVIPPPVPQALYYKVGEIPAGLTERARYVGADGSATRTWRRSTGNVRVELQTRKPQDANDPAANEGVPVTVNGRPAFYHAPGQGDDKSYVEWRLGAEVVSVNQLNLGMSKAELLKVAQSVQLDSGPQRTFAELAVSVTGGGTVTMRETGTEVAGKNASSWLMTVSFEEPQTHSPSPPASKEGKSGPRALTAQFGTSTPAPDGGQAITVNGHPARDVGSDQGPAGQVHMIVVDYGGGHLGTFIGNGLDDADVINAAGSFQFPAPDLSWLGR